MLFCKQVIQKQRENYSIVGNEDIEIGNDWHFRSENRIFFVDY